MTTESPLKPPRVFDAKLDSAARGQLGQQAAEPTTRLRRGTDLSLPDVHVAGQTETWPWWPWSAVVAVVVSDGDGLVAVVDGQVMVFMVNCGLMVKKWLMVGAVQSVDDADAQVMAC